MAQTAISASSKTVAEHLLRTGAVTINTEKQFVYTSGIVSPIYTDNRMLLSFPMERRRIVGLLAEAVVRSGGLDSFEVVAGVATAGISWAALLADRLDKPMVYVRSEAKEHGKRQQIEGVLREGDRAIVLEDLVSTGGSVIEAANGVREAGGIADDAFALFTYNMPASLRNFQGARLRIHTLTTIQDLLPVAIELGYITADQRKVVDAWLESRAT